MRPGVVQEFAARGAVSSANATVINFSQGSELQVTAHTLYSEKWTS